MMQATISRFRSSIAGDASPLARAVLFGSWLVVAAFFTWHHVLWRDEVRALSLALTGGDVVAMARAVHGEGHPMLWYLMLRGAHAVVPVREVLPVLGFAVGAAAAGFFAWRAPFRVPMLALVLSSAWMTFEYSAMARNYGISVLLMLVLADRFARRREAEWRGALTTGMLFLLLANTNVPSVILAGGFLLFWLVEIAVAGGPRRAASLARWGAAAALLLIGVGVCFVTVYPPFNEAAVSPLAAGLTPFKALAAMVNIGVPMSYLFPGPLAMLPGSASVLTALVLAAAIAFAGSPAGIVAAAVVLEMLLLFFQFVYPGSYRHEALFLCYLLALRWMIVAGRGGAWSARTHGSIRSIRRVGETGFFVLMLLQTAQTAWLVREKLRGRVEGQSAATAALLARPGLRGAVVMAVPEVMVEPLRYYAANPTWLVRQHRWGDVARFTRHADVHLTLGTVLAAARRLQATTHRPVVLLIGHQIGRDPAEQFWDEGILGDVTARPGEAIAFLDATRLIARPIDLIQFGQFDERYWVYLLNAPVTRS